MDERVEPRPMCEDCKQAESIVKLNGVNVCRPCYEQGLVLIRAAIEKGLYGKPPGGQ